MSNKRPASLIFRVTTMVGIATTASLFALGIFVQHSIEAHFLEQEAEELQVVATAVNNALSSFSDVNPIEFSNNLEHAVSGHHGVYFLVANNNQGIIYQSPGPDLNLIATSIRPVDSIEADSLYRWNDGNSIYRGAVLRMSNNIDSTTQQSDVEYTVVVAAAMDFHLQFLSSFNRVLWLTIAGISLFAIFAAWFAARQAHAPIHRLSAKIGNVGSDRLDIRLDEGKYPVELSELVRSFNTMIIKIEDVFGKLSNFSADIAHELRTPITNIITQTQVSLGKARDVAEYREILYSNLEEYERMAAMVSNMLFLAQTDNGLIKPKFEKLDVKLELLEQFDFFEALAEDRSIKLNLSGGNLWILGDKSMLRRAFSNLLSNAINHSPDKCQVDVNIQLNGNFVEIKVQNPSNPLEPDKLSRIFDRFYKVDSSRHSEGAGLGLAIAKSIIEIHNSSIAATYSEGRTTFTVRVPVQDQL